MLSLAFVRETEIAGYQLPAISLWRYYLIYEMEIQPVTTVKSSSESKLRYAELGSTRRVKPRAVRKEAWTSSSEQ